MIKVFKNSIFVADKNALVRNFTNKIVYLHMQKLNFPDCDFRFRKDGDVVSIFDGIRRKFIVLTPEEWVRQHTVQFLLIEKKYPKSLVNVEKVLKINGLTKRYDIVVFNPNGSIRILVECKAPSVIISQSTFDQIARYNMAMQAEYLMVTNGMNHYFCQVDFREKKYNFLNELPDCL